MASLLLQGRHIFQFIILWFSLYVQYTKCLTESDLIPFSSDTLIPGNDDHSYQVDLQTHFKFLGVNYQSKVYLNTNGQISFLSGISTYTPANWSSSTPPSIAIFWADINTLSGGSIRYKRSAESHILNKVKQDIVRAFPEEQEFGGIIAFVTTWQDVPFHAHDNEGFKKRNTFQCIMTTDGTKSFVIFNYVKLDWAGNGNVTTGLGRSAQVGFSSGSVTGSYSFDDAMTDDIVNLVHKSNVNIPGKFVFRVDQGVMEPTNQHFPNEWCNFFINGIQLFEAREASYLLWMY